MDSHVLKYSVKLFPRRRRDVDEARVTTTKNQSLLTTTKKTRRYHGLLPMSPREDDEVRREFSPEANARFAKQLWAVDQKWALNAFRVGELDMFARKKIELREAGCCALCCASLACLWTLTCASGLTALYCGDPFEGHCDFFHECFDNIEGGPMHMSEMREKRLKMRAAGAAGASGASSGTEGQQGEQRGEQSASEQGEQSALEQGVGHLGVGQVVSAENRRTAEEEYDATSLAREQVDLSSQNDDDDMGVRHTCVERDMLCCSRCCCCSNCFGLLGPGGGCCLCCLTGTCGPCWWTVSTFLCNVCTCWGYEVCREKEAGEPDFLESSSRCMHDCVRCGVGFEASRGPAFVENDCCQQNPWVALGMGDSSLNCCGKRGWNCVLSLMVVYAPCVTCPSCAALWIWQYFNLCERTSPMAPRIIAFVRIISSTHLTYERS